MSASPPPRLTAPEPPSEPEPDRRRGRRWWAPWLVSGALHLGVLAWWASLPEPARHVGMREPDLRAIELVELPPRIAEEPAPAPAEEPEPAPAEPPMPSAEEPAPASPREPDDGSRRPRGPAAPSEPTRPAEPTEPVGPAVPSEPSTPGGVSLLGLRGESRTATAGTGSLRPELAPPAMGHGRVSRQVGSQRPAPAGFDDGKPRTLEEAGFRTRRSGKRVYKDETGRFTATLLPDGRIKFRDMPVAVSRDPLTGAPKGLGMPGLAEGLRAASGIELYQQEKKRLLEATFELRLELAISFAQDKLDRRLQSLYRELLDGWSDASTSEAERREALFRRWDECEEGLPVALPGFAEADTSELDDMRRSAGAQARETIERFVRRQLPQGSPQAYTAEELRRLNASRRSRARFDPY